MVKITSGKYLYSISLCLGRCLTQVVIDGCVDDLVSRDVAVGLCRLSPADLSHSRTDDIKGQTSGFTRRWRQNQQGAIVT